ncbi:HU family DNA-binding protein [Caulobacter sp. NIBR2454]|uniref:HU family DNA-binding protein n=1 Tax=Caulobacter sp. NIBR2454 TaxID=3015996 RepID=UPI0022B6548D|nr:HU family DNA-binding protein [Caulobacter sp. NIBR2454]
MNQSELIAAAAKEAGVSQAEAGRMLDAILSTIQGALVKGEDVRLSGLGIFDVADRAAREGRNPATGETIKIAATKAVRFRPSKPMKDAVAGSKK